LQDEKPTGNTFLAGSKLNPDTIVKRQIQYVTARTANDQRFGEFSVVWAENAGMQADVNTESDQQTHCDHEYQGEPSRYCAGGCGVTILETV
jgi:hypothetical protein